MADPTVFQFVDQLVAKIRALPQCQPPVAVFDGDPGGYEADQLVAVGGTVTPLSDGKQRFAQLGALAMWEEYYVDCAISCWSGGDAGTGTAADDPAGDAQRLSRQQAVTIFNAIFEALRADPNFAVSNGGNPLVLYQRIENVSVVQVPSRQGRMTEIVFKIYVKNRISAT